MRLSFHPEWRIEQLQMRLNELSAPSFSSTISYDNNHISAAVIETRFLGIVDARDDSKRLPLPRRVLQRLLSSQTTTDTKNGSSSPLSTSQYGTPSALMGLLFRHSSNYGDDDNVRRQLSQSPLLPVPLLLLYTEEFLFGSEQNESIPQQANRSEGGDGWLPVP